MQLTTNCRTWGNRMCDLTAKTGEFIEVDYTFKIDIKD